jgi:hypothetical protein
MKEDYIQVYIYKTRVKMVVYDEHYSVLCLRNNNELKRFITSGVSVKKTFSFITNVAFK